MQLYVETVRPLKVNVKHRFVFDVGANLRKTHKTHPEKINWGEATKVLLQVIVISDPKAKITWGEPPVVELSKDGSCKNLHFFVEPIVAGKLKLIVSVYLKKELQLLEEFSCTLQIISK